MGGAVVTAPQLRPITQAEAFAYVREHHRHHGVPTGALWQHGVHDGDGCLCGVAVVGRPVSRKLDDGWTMEVTRLCTTGKLDACSTLYAAARRAAEAKGYRRGLSYILSSEDGHSLIAAGWRYLWTTDGGSWDRAGRPREDKCSTEPKDAYGWGAWRELAKAGVAAA